MNDEPENSERQFVALDDARFRLAKVWFIGGAIPFGTMIIQSALGKFGDDVQQAWAWLLPNLMPTLLLMVGVLGAAALTTTEKRRVRGSYYAFSLWLSVAYLITISATSVLELFSSLSPIRLMTMSNYWLTPLQGLAAGSIGFLFTTHEAAQQRIQRDADQYEPRPNSPTSSPQNTASE